MKGTEVKNQQTLNDIKTRELLSMLRKIALPIALQSLIGSSLSLIDNLMVGSLGELQLNAVGVSVQIFFRLLDAAVRHLWRCSYVYLPVLWCGRL